MESRDAVGFMMVVAVFSSGAFGQLNSSSEGRVHALALRGDRFVLKSTERWVTTVVAGSGTSVKGRESRGEAIRELKVSGKRAWLAQRQRSEGPESVWNTWWIEGHQLTIAGAAGDSAVMIAFRESDESYLPFRATDGGLLSTATPSAWLDGDVPGAEIILKSLRMTGNNTDQTPKLQRMLLDGGRLEQVILDTAKERKAVTFDRDHGSAISSLELQLGPDSSYMGMPLREAFGVADKEQASLIEAQGNSASPVVRMNVHVTCESFTQFHGVWLATSGRRVEIMTHEDGTQQRTETFAERQVADLTDEDGIFRRNVDVKNATPVIFPDVENVIPLMWWNGRIVAAVDNRMVQAIREEAIVGKDNKRTTQPAVKEDPPNSLGEDRNAWERIPIIAQGLLDVSITSTQPTASGLPQRGEILGRGVVALITVGVMSLLLIGFWALKVCYSGQRTSEGEP